MSLDSKEKPLLPTKSSNDEKQQNMTYGRVRNDETFILLLRREFPWRRFTFKLVLLCLGFVGCYVLSANIIEEERSFHAASWFKEMKTKEACHQADILIPSAEKPLYDNLAALYKADTFRERAVSWLGGAVRVPTESFDDLGKIGEDKRWDVFSNFHEYLLGAFPGVHTTLELTKVNTYGLLYVWPGSDSSLKPILLAAHQDVVPVNPSTWDEWTHPPFSGYFDGERIWGRGSSDDKSGLVGVLSSIETLIEGGFKPTRTIVLSFGFDEEVSGRQGAGALSKVLLERYGEDGVALVIDEGSSFMERDGTVFAMPGVGEKGYLDVRVAVSANGGHSSIPPKHTTIGILSALLVEYENNPYEVQLTRDNPIYHTLQCIAEYAKDLPSSYRKTIKKARDSNHGLRQLEEAIKEDPITRALVGTTQAIDIISGGVKANALPEQAWALVNHRISVISSLQETQDHDAELLKPLAQRFNLTYEAFGKILTNGSISSSGSLVISDAYGTGLEPAPVTPSSKDAEPWKVLSGTIKATYNAHRSIQGADNIIVSPSMMSGNTDTRYYWKLTRHIFRYNHSNAGKDGPLGKIHTVNESREIDAFLEMIEFFTTLILNADEATSF